MPSLFRRIVYKISDKLSLTAVQSQKGVTLGEGLYIFGRPFVENWENSTIKIGNRVALVSRCDQTQLGVNHPVVIRTLNPNASIEIGDETGMSGATICAAVSVKIGKRCLLGANVTIVDTDFHPIDRVPRRF